MINYFPGTVVERNNRTTKDFLYGIFCATKGLMLGQVKEVTGLDTSAIQNWVNRGWIKKPVNKRYTVDHLARILIINMLRDVLRLENIVEIMTYINGNANDPDDDIIPESRLYNYICDILDKVDFEDILMEAVLIRIINETIEDYKEESMGAREKLIKGLQIILVYYASAIIKVKADNIYTKTIKKG